MLSVFARLTALAFLGTLFAAGSRSQDPGEAPKPAMAGGDALQSGPAADVPDTRPLGGVQNLTLGSSKHSFLLPSFGVTTQAQFRPSSSSTESFTYISGRLALNKTSARSELLVDYLTGGGFSSSSGQSTSPVQNLDASETIRGGRWQLMFGEALSYLPGSSFNFSGLGGLNNLGVGLGSLGTAPGFRSNLIPNQSIFTNSSDRFSSSTLAQTTYLLSYRSSISFFGTYGTLHFLEGGLQDSHFVSSGAGYNYLLSPLNSMSVSYGYGRFGISGVSTTVESHSAQISFARRITGRLSVQVGAGPDFQLFSSSLAGPRTIVSWSLNSALSYQLGRWGMGASYDHALTGGAGVLPGAETDIFSGHLSRAFGSWQTSLSGGYARNASLQQTSRISTTPQGWFVGAQVSRGLRSFGNFFVSYNVWGQSSLAAVCPASACRSNGVTQTVSVGYNWGFRPIALE